ncbi:MAG: S1 RNA-binding domain-containing protein, partial [Ignavibacteria bacterium]|nr:S1 RNA-binding domain-containing protein [Ignavibacteria bacterium]
MTENLSLENATEETSVAEITNAVSNEITPVEAPPHTDNIEAEPIHSPLLDTAASDVGTTPETIPNFDVPPLVEAAAESTFASESEQVSIAEPVAIEEVTPETPEPPIESNLNNPLSENITIENTASDKTDSENITVDHTTTQHTTVENSTSDNTIQAESVSEIHSTEVLTPVPEKLTPEQLAAAAAHAEAEHKRNEERAEAERKRAEERAEVERKRTEERAAIQKALDEVFEELTPIKEAGGTIIVEIAERIKGGLRAMYKNVRLFLPASHYSIKRSANEQDLNEAVGKTLTVHVQELQQDDQGRKTIVVSHKKIAREEFFNSLQEGSVVDGKVASVTGFGVFVDLNGIEGLIHIS